MLVYDVQAYARYEVPTPEDWIKKSLELALFEWLVDVTSIRRSLDIGTATCRYPRYLSRFGADVFGVDISTAGYRYIRPQLAEKVSFVQADARHIPFSNGSFDLVTCMMGTFNHIRVGDRRGVLGEMARVLSPGGKVVISAWDSECEFQGYLSIYSAEEIDLLRRERIDPKGLEPLLSDAGFARVRRMRFNCFADQLVRTLDAASETGNLLRRTVDLDAAVRAESSDPPAQMFMVVGEIARS